MQINPIGSNQTELHLDNGTIIMFSYKTPVAACMGDGSGFIRTNHKWSVTTSKHINKWIDGRAAKEVPQATLNALA